MYQALQMEEKEVQVSKILLDHDFTVKVRHNKENCFYLYVSAKFHCCTCITSHQFFNIPIVFNGQNL